MKVSLNKEYCLRNEKECSYIVCKATDKNIKNKLFPLVMPIPPAYGYILSFFNGASIKESINKIEKELDLKEGKLQNFIHKLLNNPYPYITYIDNIKVYFPSNLLIYSNELANIHTHEDFDVHDRFILKRPVLPFFINVMITSKCHTDCIYCYADRSRKDDMNLKIILKIINEAKIERIPNVLISGGDIFATKYWKDILAALVSNGYPQLLSTKIPLKEEDIMFLKRNAVDEIQISIDSLESTELNKIVRVNNLYRDKMLKTFEYAQKHDLHINIKTVLTKYNANYSSLQNTLSIISKYKCVKSWNIVPAFFSSHKSDYDEYKMDMNTINPLLDFIEAQKSNIPITVKKMQEAISTIQKKHTSVSKFVMSNKSCTANSYGLAIMSNGKATVCEMLYYKEEFQIGDTKLNTLKEIWNSSQARILSFQESSATSPQSPCLSCEELEKCKLGNMKKVCLVDVINTYGSKKWNYPDPRCPKSTGTNMEKVVF